MSDLDRHYERRLERRAVAGVVEVYDTNRDIYVGRLVNIHSEGLMLMGDVALEPDHVYQLDLQLPTPLMGESTIHLGVDCLWVRDPEGSTAIWSGCHIIDASEKAHQQIEALLDLQS